MRIGEMANGEPLIQLRGLCKSFPGVTALDDVSLTLGKGTIHALLGENGAGKSTLINLLSGVLQPDVGEMALGGRRMILADAHAARAEGIATVHQEADLFPDLTVAENVALEHGWPRRHGLIDWSALRQTTRQALHALGRDLDPQRLAATLTPAERQLVGIAAALSQDAVVLILDEPTSSLSAAESQTLFTHLRQFRAQGGAILYVSHRLEEVFQLADAATVLRDGRNVWSGSLKDTTPDRLIASMVGRENTQANSRPSTQTRAGAEQTPVHLTCAGLTAADGSFRDVNLEVRAGEILGLYGLIGAGRSEWAQAVFGLRSVAAGRIRLHGQPWQPTGPGEAARRGLAYLPEDRLRYGLCSGLAVRANAVLAALRRFSFGPFISSRIETRQAQIQVEQLSIRLHSLLQRAGTLSGGNQQKVVLGRWLACQPANLILDEPTRGVDVGAKAEIHALLRRLAESGRAIILISSDLPEVLANSDRIGVFRSGRLVAVYEAHSTTPEQVAATALPIGADIQDQLGSAPIARRLIARRASKGMPFPLLARRAIGALPSGSRLNVLRELGLLAVVLLLMAGLALGTDNFWKAGTLRDVGENAGLLVLCGLGASLVILAGGIDISLGSIMALGAAVCGLLMEKQHWPLLLAVIAGLAAAAAAGCCNAILTLVGKVHPIVVTLGTMSAYRGLTILLIGNDEIKDVPDAFQYLFHAAPLGVPLALWLALLVVGLAWFFLGWTVGGRQTLALGSNAAAAARTGIHRTRVWLAVFTLQGLLAGLAGILALAMTRRLQATDFDEKTLEAISVAVVGGIAITGGRGLVWGIWAAALLFRVLEKGWFLLHISSYWQRTIVGSLLLVAILADQLWRRQSEQME